MYAFDPVSSIRNEKNLIKFSNFYCGPGASALRQTYSWLYDKGRFPEQIIDHWEEIKHKFTTNERCKLEEIKKDPSKLKQLDITFLYKLIQVGTDTLSPPNDAVWSKNCPPEDEDKLEHLLFLVKKTRNDIAHHEPYLMDLTDQNVNDECSTLILRLSSIIRQAGMKVHIPQSIVDDLVEHLTKELEEICDKINPVIPSSFISNEKAGELTLNDIQENTFYVMKDDFDGKKYAKVKVEDQQISFEEWEEETEEGSYYVDFFHFISSRIAVIDTHKFIREHKEELHNPKIPSTRFKCSKIEVQERSIYFYCFKKFEGGDFVIEFESLLKILGCSSVLPTASFLKIQSSSAGEVVIATDGRSPRALNLLLLASGIMDVSYQGTLFCFDDSNVQGGYNNNGTLFNGVVEGIQDGGIYRRNETKRGDVKGWDAKEPNSLSYFRVWKKGNIWSSATTFGSVKRGMEVVDQIEWGNVINKCGLLLDLS